MIIYTFQHDFSLTNQHALPPLDLVQVATALEEDIIVGGSCSDLIRLDSDLAQRWS